MKINRYTIEQHLLEKQLSYIGHTLKDAVENPNWKNEWVFPKEDIEDFTKYAIPLFKKVFKTNRSIAVNNFNWFLVKYKLKVI